MTQIGTKDVPESSKPICSYDVREDYKLAV